MDAATPPTIKFDPKTKQLFCQGKWDLSHITTLRKALKQVSLPTTGNIVIDGHAITEMDSAGAWLFSKWLKKITRQGLNIELQNFSESQQKLLALVQKKIKQKIQIPKVKIPNWLAKIGKLVIEQLREAYDYLSFVGLLTLTALRIIGRPTHMGWRELAGTIYKSGYQALPIVTLLSFMVGVVLAHQTGTQLQKYGANIFIVDLLGFSILREFGPLITAIIVAGRTGSAFTAQLGIMKINQEIDALNTMSISPAELLLLPRIIALFIVLPLLTIWADIFGIIGGMIATAGILKIGLGQFLYRFQVEVPSRALIIGLAKAPIFALIIASIGCFQGMQVERNADSVGRLTTRSVVLSIFFVVIADAAFSILFSLFKL